MKNNPVTDMKSHPWFIARFIPAFLLTCLVLGCGPRHEAEKGEHRGLRAACASDIEKFCANGDSRPRRCLRDHEDSLSADCRAALAKHHGEGKKDNWNSSD